MYTCPIQLKDVRYNAVTQSFEAAVTVHDNSTVRTYACDIPAPISMSYADAAEGLSRQAIRRHQHRGGLFSETHRVISAPRAGRPSTDPVRWLKKLVDVPMRAAA